MTDALTPATTPSLAELPPVALRTMTPGAPAESVAGRPEAPSLPHHAALRGHKVQLLVNQMAARGFANHVATATVLPLKFDADTLKEVMAMQAAVMKRLQQQQENWAQGVTEIVQDYSRIRLANTLSKFVEQEYNLGAQLGALMTSQVSQFVNLMENIQVDYGYWITQKQSRPG